MMIVNEIERNLAPTFGPKLCRFNTLHTTSHTSRSVCTNSDRKKHEDMNKESRLMRDCEKKATHEKRN